jgi:hypothetical protein
MKSRSGMRISGRKAEGVTEKIVFIILVCIILIVFSIGVYMLMKKMLRI